MVAVGERGSSLVLRLMAVETSVGRVQVSVGGLVGIGRRGFQLSLWSARPDLGFPAADGPQHSGGHQSHSAVLQSLSSLSPTASLALSLETWAGLDGGQPDLFATKGDKQYVRGSCTTLQATQSWYTALLPR